MNELEFSECLKQLRKAKNMTQQDLADQLGVSNKSVSRWESGSYPDVATLGPLAKALGVTVDDLLGETPPLRSLNRSDWQNLLSFAFVLGGGILFFLLNLFVPTILCYGLYLSSMAYGVYLQKNYTYHSRWFRWSNLTMLLFVNIRMVGKLVLPLLYADAMSDPSNLFQALQTPQFTTTLLMAQGVPALVLTVLIGYGIHLYEHGSGKFGWKIRWTRPTLTRVLPALIPLLLTGYWCLFLADTRILPTWFYAGQMPIFYGLLLALTLLSVLWLRRRGQTSFLPATLLMSIATAAFPVNLSGMLRAYSDVSTTIYDFNFDLNPERYHAFQQARPELIIMGIVIAVVYILVGCIRLEEKTPAKED